MKPNQQAITGSQIWVALLVLSVLIGMLVALMEPRLTIGGVKGPVTGVLYQMRQLQAAADKMEYDGVNGISANPDIRWTCSGTVPLTLKQWRDVLTSERYLETNQFDALMHYVQKERSWFLPGNITNTITAYAVTDSDPPDTVFLSTPNWHGDTTTNLSGDVFGRNTFIVFHKGGDGEIFGQNNLTNAASASSGGMHDYLPLR